MKIRKFKATKVNGYLQFDIDFFNEITFLVGINGSGKTTALKLILGLINPSWVILNQTPFETAEVEFESHNNEVYNIIAKTTEENIELSIKQLDVKPCKFPRIDLPNTIPNHISSFETRQILSNYSRQEQLFSKYPVVRKIQEFPTPIFLGIDRRIYEGREIDFINIENFPREREFTKSFKSNLQESLKEIEELIKDNFLEFTEIQTNIKETLKNKIIQSMFELLTENQLAISINTDPIKLAEKKKLVEKAAKNINVPGIQDSLNDYFTTLEEVQKKLFSKSKKPGKQKIPDKEELKLLQTWFINMPQLQRIDKLISLFEESEEQTRISYAQFQKFEELANQFLFESNKKLLVGSNGELIVYLPDETISNVYRLSSGEKQILVMLAQLIFRESKKKIGSVFIIDEPEISLHLEWQELFVESIRQASPNTQFILATHSPTIIGNITNQEFCQDVAKLNIR